MKMIGRREIAIAPTTIFVLNRAPSCSRPRSAQSRRMVRARMRPKTRKAAVMKLETAYSTITARQLFGSSGTVRDPNVKTAASSSVRRIPPMARPQLCFLSNRLMTWPSGNRQIALRSARSADKSATCCTHTGRFWSTTPSHGQSMSVLFAQASLWHDSQRTEASQDSYLSSIHNTCPFGQVLAISERRMKFQLPSASAFAKVSAGCKPNGSAADVRPSGRNIS